MRWGWLQDLMRAIAGPPKPARPVTIQICPAPGSEDLIELVHDPAALRVLSRVASHFQFYAGHFIDPSPSQVGGNTYDTLRGIEAVRKVHEAGFSVGVEAPALKPWSLDVEVYIAHTLDILAKAGGMITTVAMDEPWGAAETMAGLSWDDRQIAAHVAGYMRGVREVARPDLLIGLIEPYPAVPLTVWLRAFEALRSAGARLDFVRIDVDANYCRELGWARVERELRRIRLALREQSIPMGVIVWGFEDRTAADFTRSSLALLTRYQWIFGSDWPEQLMVQSWSRDGDDPRRVPPIGSIGRRQTLAWIAAHAQSELSRR